MSNNNLLVLVDTSYTSFYRFFATIRWYSFAYPEEYKIYKIDNTYDWSKNNIFIEKYEKMYLDSIIKLIGKKKYKDSKIIFCMDSPKEDLWRIQIQCNYKGDRTDMSKKYNFKTTFNYTYETIIPNLIKSFTNISSIRVEKIEADDVIAIICMYQKETNPTQEILLISGDEDFLQLGRNQITFINYKSKKPKKITEDEALVSLTNKIILGDSSDCIPSIFPKGIKISNIKKKEVIESNESLIQLLESNQEIKKQYLTNQKMIDFKNIPKIYYNKVVKIFNFIHKI
jgi:5'-3' exonuclease